MQQESGKIRTGPSDEPHGRTHRRRALQGPVELVLDVIRVARLGLRESGRARDVVVRDERARLGRDDVGIWSARRTISFLLRPPVSISPTLTVADSQYAGGTNEVDRVARANENESELNCTAKLRQKRVSKALRAGKNKRAGNGRDVLGHLLQLVRLVAVLVEQDDIASRLGSSLEAAECGKAESVAIRALPVERNRLTQRALALYAKMPGQEQDEPSEDNLESARSGAQDGTDRAYRRSRTRKGG